jgi:hypothetical protein
MGFKQVYVSFIPNPVSIVYPTYNNYTYNELISRIQSSRSLRIPFIDVYTDLKNSTVPVYSCNDTHWNWDGCNLWLDHFNDSLSRYAK